MKHMKSFISTFAIILAVSLAARRVRILWSILARLTVAGVCLAGAAHLTLSNSPELQDRLVELVRHGGGNFDHQLVVSRAFQRLEKCRRQLGIFSNAVFFPKQEEMRLLSFFEQSVPCWS